MITNSAAECLSSSRTGSNCKDCKSPFLNILLLLKNGFYRNEHLNGYTMMLFTF